MPAGVQNFELVWRETRSFSWLFERSRHRIHGVAFRTTASAGSLPGTGDEASSLAPTRHGSSRSSTRFHRLQMLQRFPIFTEQMGMPHAETGVDGLPVDRRRFTRSFHLDRRVTIQIDMQ